MKHNYLAIFRSEFCRDCYLDTEIIEADTEDEIETKVQDMYDSLRIEHDMHRVYYELIPLLKDERNKYLFIVAYDRGNEYEEFEVKDENKIPIAVARLRKKYGVSYPYYWTELDGWKVDWQKIKQEKRKRVVDTAITIFINSAMLTGFVFLLYFIISR